MHFTLPVFFVLFLLLRFSGLVVILNFLFCYFFMLLFCFILFVAVFDFFDLLYFLSPLFILFFFPEFWFNGTFIFFFLFFYWGKLFIFFFFIFLKTDSRNPGAAYRLRVVRMTQGRNYVGLFISSLLPPYIYYYSHLAANSKRKINRFYQ